MAVFFTSDHHFGDARRLRIERRPFGSVAEMDRAMAERWDDEADAAGRSAAA